MQWFPGENLGQKFRCLTDAIWSKDTGFFEVQMFLSLKLLKCMRAPINKCTLCTSVLEGEWGRGRVRLKSHKIKGRR